MRKDVPSSGRYYKEVIKSDGQAQHMNIKFYSDEYTVIDISNAIITSTSLPTSGSLEDLKNPDNQTPIVFGDSTVEIMIDFQDIIKIHHIELRHLQAGSLSYNGIKLSPDNETYVTLYDTYQSGIIMESTPIVIKTHRVFQIDERSGLILDVEDGFFDPKLMIWDNDKLLLDYFNDLLKLSQHYSMYTDSTDTMIHLVNEIGLYPDNYKDNMMINWIQLGSVSGIEEISIKIGNLPPASAVFHGGSSSMSLDGGKPYLAVYDEKTSKFLIVSGGDEDSAGSSKSSIYVYQPDSDFSNYDLASFDPDSKTFITPNVGDLENIVMVDAIVFIEGNWIRGVLSGIIEVDDMLDTSGDKLIPGECYVCDKDNPRKITKIEPVSGLVQPILQVYESDGKLVGYIASAPSYIANESKDVRRVGKGLRWQGEILEAEMTDEVDTYNPSDSIIPSEIGVTRLLGKVKTIEELKRLRFLKAGDVVEVLGYYESGDGAGHKRVIAQEDDGSGVQLENGLYANIVHNGEVNVSWFGTKGDGVTDDTQAIQKSINYSCNNIFIPKGNYLVASGIAVQNKKIKGEIGARITVNKNLQTYLFNVSDTIINNINIISNDYILYGFLCKNNVEVSKCYFEGRFGNCIRISEADSVIIDRCYVSENSEQTTTIYVGYSSNITISENIIKNHTGFGIQALVSNNVIFKNNSITQKYIEKEVILNNNIPVEFTNDFNISRYTLELDGNFINCTLEKQDDTFILKEYGDVSGTAKFRGWTGLECLQANSGCDNVRIEKNFVYNSGDSGIVIGADYHYNGEKWVLQPESVVIGDYPKNIVVDGNMINGVVKASGIALNNAISAIVTNNNIKNVGYITNIAYRNGILIGLGYGRIVSGNITENIYGNIYGCVSSKGNSNNVGTNTENKDDIIGYNKGIGCKNLETFATSDNNRRRIGYRIIDANYDYSLNQYIKDFVDSKSTSFSSEFIKCSILGATGVRFNEEVTYAYPISIVPAPNEYLNLTFNKNILGIFENKIVKLDFYAKTENGNRVRLYYKPKNLNVEPSAEIQITSENWEKYSIQLAIGSIEEFFIRIGGANDKNTTYISDLKLTLIEVE